MTLVATTLLTACVQNTPHKEGFSTKNNPYSEVKITEVSDLNSQFKTFQTALKDGKISPAEEPAVMKFVDEGKPFIGKLFIEKNNNGKRTLTPVEVQNPVADALMSSLENLVETSGRNENLVSIPNNSRPELLIQKLLQNNDGLALLDRHSQSVEFDFVAENIDVFSQNGVTQIYIELPRDLFIAKNGNNLLDQFNNSEYGSPVEQIFLQKVADVIGYEASKQPVAKTLLEAKKHGIKIIAMDINEENPYINLKDRATACNIVWTRNINKGNRKLASNEKFIVIGGASHFKVNDPKKSPYFRSGVVDELLDIPSISFKPAKKSYAEHSASDDQDYVIHYRSQGRGQQYSSSDW